MKPDRAEAMLRGVAGSLQIFIDELEALKIPEAKHLLGHMQQCRLCLLEMIERENQRPD